MASSKDRWGKDAKIGEGTYAVVYKGERVVDSCYRCLIAVLLPGREISTGRQVAIKKIKIGQFKDGLDMSAVREVKYLRELHHPNVIEVRKRSSIFQGCRLTLTQLLDVYSTKQNLNLVLEFLEGGDLELVIKDRNIVFLPADIKSWMAMTCRGLEFCHRNWVLHRVRSCAL